MKGKSKIPAKLKRVNRVRVQDAKPEILTLLTARSGKGKVSGRGVSGKRKVMPLKRRVSAKSEKTKPSTSQSWTSKVQRGIQRRESIKIRIEETPQRKTRTSGGETGRRDRRNVSFQAISVKKERSTPGRRPGGIKPG